MTDIVQTFSNHPSAFVAITMGLEHWRKGETTLQVYGSGKIKIVNKQSGNVNHYDGQLDDVKVKTFAKTLSEADFTQLEPSGGPRKPDDVPITVALFVDDEVRAESQKLWYGDRSKHPHLNTIITQFDALVSELTSNALPY